MTGTELTEIIEWCGLTKDQFADYCGVSRTAIWRIENGDDPVPRYLELAIRSLEPTNNEFIEWLRKLPIKKRCQITKRIYATDAYIYALKDPRDSSVRYVGRTNDVKKRLKLHLLDKMPSNKASWINELKEEGLVPVIEILEKVDRKHMVEAEKEWIFFYRKSDGHKLLNSDSRRV